MKIKMFLIALGLVLSHTQVKADEDVVFSPDGSFGASCHCFLKGGGSTTTYGSSNYNCSDAMSIASSRCGAQGGSCNSNSCTGFGDDELVRADFSSCRAGCESSYKSCMSCCKGENYGRCLNSCTNSWNSCYVGCK